ncbi:HpcH/HpaI aldolase/citrate lyase family protein [Brucella anthropi]|uniref:HpcH/HpaI aldolase/citrate lyase family protein n=1 Tax=Brucella anthropi TaxID=529 RepID=A0A6I0DHF5_BRUAN|nr:HpcH/HpaI aldolase/citrate lyase family protein [Brucella anthropi]KAB2790319.1 HpcH/HpaI aldolase/citrate lyase family protein [Brucella anthropi]
MPAPVNIFKQALQAGEPLFGTWSALASALCAEIASRTGFDWIVLDGEHAPNDLRSILSQLQAVAASPCHPVVRLPVGDTALIKQFLDIGAQTLLIPMVDTPQDAARVAAATQYPPKGRRGIGSALARSGGFGTTTDYLTTAGEQICVIAQVESRSAIASIDAIAATDGIDAVFFGPSDLAADMGLIGQTSHPDVVAAVEEGIRAVVAAGKPAGVLAMDPDLVARFIAAGATFVAVATDVNALVVGLRSRRAQFKSLREINS